MSHITDVSWTSGSGSSFVVLSMFCCLSPSFPFSSVDFLAAKRGENKIEGHGEEQNHLSTRSLSVLIRNPPIYPVSDFEAQDGEWSDDVSLPLCLPERRRMMTTTTRKKKRLRAEKDKKNITGFHS